MLGSVLYLISFICVEIFSVSDFFHLWVNRDVLGGVLGAVWVRVSRTSLTGLDTILIFIWTEFIFLTVNKTEMKNVYCKRFCTFSISFLCKPTLSYGQWDRNLVRFTCM